MKKNIFKILEKPYVQRIFEKKKDLYFPSQQNKKIIDLKIKKESPDWIKKSCLTKYEITFSDLSKKVVRATATIDGSKKRTFRIMNFLYRLPWKERELQIARPLDYIDEVKTFFYEEVPGTPLNLLLEKKKPSLSIFENVGKFLFQLHAIRNIKTRAILFELNDYKKTFERIKKILPSFSDLIPSLKEIAFLKNLNKGFYFIHADLYPSNIIVDENKIAIVDFDKAGGGYFLVDLLPFYFYFELPQLKPLKFSLDEINEFRNTFLKSYCKLREISLSKIKKELNKFQTKIFLDCLHHVVILAYGGWEIVETDLKKEFTLSIKILLKKLNKALKYAPKEY